MAKFCKSCGSPAVDNQRFCNKCGAQIETAGASPASPGSSPPAPISAPPTPGPTQAPSPAMQATVAPATAAAKKSSPVLKIVLAVLGFFVVIGVLAIGSCFYIVHKGKQYVTSIAEHTGPGTGSSSTPEMHLSEGGAGSKAAATATVDIPPYPDSTPTQSGGELSAGLSGSASAQEYETPDSVEKVEAFYRGKFGSKITFVESDSKAMFNYLSSRGMTTVTITREEGADKTKINIARIGR